MPRLLATWFLLLALSQLAPGHSLPASSAAKGGRRLRAHNESRFRVVSQASPPGPAPAGAPADGPALGPGPVPSSGVPSPASETGSSTPSPAPAPGSSAPSPAPAHSGAEVESLRLLFLGSTVEPTCSPPYDTPFDCENYCNVV